MEMKKLRTKQAVICFIGVAVCKLGFAGCYPFIPAYFAAAYLERGGRLLLGIGMFLGMAFMLPLFRQPAQSRIHAPIAPR